MSEVITRAKALQAHILNMDSGSGDAALIGELIASLEAVIDERNVQTDLRQIAENAAFWNKAEVARLTAALATARRDALDALNRANGALQYAEQWDTVSEVNAAIRALIAQEQEPTT